VKFQRRIQPIFGRLDAAAFAGVFFLLVLFLLLHSSLVLPPGLHVRLPEAPGLPGVDAPSAMVAIDANGQLYFENQVLTQEQFRSRLAALVQRTAAPIVLALMADRSVRYETIVGLGALARAAGVRDLVYVVRPPLGGSDAGSPKPQP
jgi:biopolymer transport protein ExbD